MKTTIVVLLTVLTGTMSPGVTRPDASAPESEGATSQPTSRPASQPVSPPDSQPEEVVHFDVEPDSTLAFRLEIGSRLYPDWKEEHEVGLGQRFFLGDTEYTAEAARFLPDFRIDEGRPVSVSLEWLNPALEIRVFQDTAAVDTVWAFRNFPPHYSAESFFTFKLVDILKPGAKTEE